MDVVSLLLDWPFAKIVLSTRVNTLISKVNADKHINNPGKFHNKIFII